MIELNMCHCRSLLTYHLSIMFQLVRAQFAAEISRSFAFTSLIVDICLFVSYLSHLSPCSLSPSSSISTIWRATTSSASWTLGCPTAIGRWSATWWTIASSSGDNDGDKSRENNKLCISSSRNKNGKCGDQLEYKCWIVKTKHLLWEPLF